MFVKGATNHRQVQGEPRGKQPWSWSGNRGHESKNDLGCPASDLGLFSLCKRLILWYKVK
jgi:hypothetical protein